MSALAGGNVLEPSISQMSLITDRALGDRVDLPHQLYMATSSAWSNTGTFARLLKEVGLAVQETRERLATEAEKAGDASRAAKIRDHDKCPAVLIMDNLGIHSTEIARQVAEKYNIKLVYLPAGLTDQMQVLDTHIFAAFKRKLRGSIRSFQRALRQVHDDKIRELQRQYAGKAVPDSAKPPRVHLDEAMAPAIVFEACHAAILNSTNAAKGFNDNGQFPLDPTKVVSPVDWLHLQKEKVLPTEADKLLSPILQLARREAGKAAEEGVEVLSADDIIASSTLLSAAGASAGTAAAGASAASSSASSAEASSSSAAASEVTSPFAQALFSLGVDRDDDEADACGDEDGQPEAKRLRTVTGAVIDCVVGATTAQEARPIVEQALLGPAVPAAEVDTRERQGAFTGGDRRSLLLHRESAAASLRGEYAAVVKERDEIKAQMEFYEDFIWN